MENLETKNQSENENNIYIENQLKVENKEVIKTILNSEQGFSLIEILIALTLLVLAGTFVAGKILDNLREGQNNSTRIQMNSLDGRLKEFKRKCGFYPTTEQGLEALVSKPSGGRECKDYPPNGFIEDNQIPKDPWDHDFVYESDGKTFNIYSYGADGEGSETSIYLHPQTKGASTKESAGAESSGGVGNTAPAESTPAQQGQNEAAPAQQ